MNTLQISDNMSNFALTVSAYCLVKLQTTKTSDRLLHCILSKQLFVTLAENHQRSGSCPVYYKVKGKVLPYSSYSLRSLGPVAYPGIQAVSPQVTF